MKNLYKLNRLVGHSWGGLLSMNYAIKHRENVLSLILLNSVPANFKGQKAFINEVAARTNPIHDKISALFNYKEFQKLNDKQINQLYRDFFSVYFNNPPEVSQLSLNLNKKSAMSGFQVMTLMSKTSWIRPEVNLFPYLYKLQVPTLIIHGNQDVIPSFTDQEIKDGIPNSEIVYLANSGHFPYIETPNELFKSLRLFLSKTQSK